MTERQKPAAPGKSQARDERQAKLAEALRANLRRRKAPADPVEARRESGGDG